MLEIIEKCSEAKYSEVKSKKWSEKSSKMKCSEVKESEVKWTKQSEVQYREGGGGAETSLYGKRL